MVTLVTLALLGFLLSIYTWRGKIPLSTTIVTIILCELVLTIDLFINGFEYSKIVIMVLPLMIFINRTFFKRIFKFKN